MKTDITYTHVLADIVGYAPGHVVNDVWELLVSRLGHDDAATKWSSACRSADHGSACVQTVRDLHQTLTDASEALSRAQGHIDSLTSGEAAHGDYDGRLGADIATHLESARLHLQSARLLQDSTISPEQLAEPVHAEYAWWVHDGEVYDLRETFEEELAPHTRRRWGHTRHFSEEQVPLMTPVGDDGVPVDPEALAVPLTALLAATSTKEAS